MKWECVKVSRKLLMKNPINSGLSIMSVNTNPDLAKFMTDKFCVPAVLKN